MSRILAYLPGYPPKDRVGAFLATHRFLAALADLGFDVTVTIPRRGAHYTVDGVEVRDLNNRVGTYTRLFTASELCISHHGDDCRLHRIAVREGKPSVRLVHGPRFLERSDFVKHGEPALVVFNSHSLASQADWDGPSVVCHPVLDLDQHQTTPGSMITLVNATEAKGARVLDALARFLPERKFLAVGPTYGDQLHIQRPNVTVVPPTQHMRDTVYRHTRILLMPSDQETWGMTAHEAMCSGIPVIAHPTAGLVESLGTAGIWADRDALDEWIDAIEALDDDKAYKAASRKARARAEFLAADDSAQRFVKAIETLL